MTPALGTKPLASLSSGLLARKGQARPAMKSQGFGGFGQSTAAALDDLGWNDMGFEGAAPRPQPAPQPVLVSPAAPVEAAPPPPVVALREALAERVETPAPPAESAPPPIAAVRPVSVATATRIGRESAEQTKKGKAAFTLRLDTERHLRVRLASALAGRSAQALVTQAVDAFLSTMPELDALVAQLPEPKRRR